MKPFVAFLLSLIPCLSFAFNGSQQIYFDKIQAGLSHQTVFTILQDKTGFLWFGTKDGLNRYDGVNFKTYYRSNYSKLGNSCITCLTEDINGEIWCGTDCGIFVYNPIKDIFRHIPININGKRIPDKTVQIIKEDRKHGVIYIAMDNFGLLRYSLKDGSLREMNINAVSSLLIDHDGSLYLGLYNNGIWYWNRKSNRLSRFSNSQNNPHIQNVTYNNIFKGPNGEILATSQYIGLQEINRDGTIQNLLERDTFGRKLFIRAVLFNTPTELWLGTEQGIIIYNPMTHAISQYKANYYDKYALSDNAIYSLCKGRDGNIWIGSYFGGVNEVSFTSSFFGKIYPGRLNYGMSGKRIRAMCSNAHGKIWIATEDHGLYLYNPITMSAQHITASDRFTNIQDIRQIGEELWVCTFGNGLKILNSNGQIVKEYHISDDFVFSIYPTHKGEIYVGTWSGLFKFNKKNNRFDRIPRFNSEFIYQIFEDDSSNLWLATYSNGVYKIAANGKIYAYSHQENKSGSLPYNKVMSIFEDSHHQIWLTTQGGGFCKYNPSSNNFTTYDKKSGFASDVIYQIVEDNNHIFWISTNNGLNTFNPRTKEIRRYSIENGLLTDKFNYRSSFKTPEGIIYFGSIEGLVFFNPDKFNKYRVKNVNLLISDFQLPNQADDTENILPGSISYLDKINLKYNQNTFTLDLILLNYSALDKYHFEYKLDGIDKDWIVIKGKSARAIYKSLSSGTYTFHYRILSNENGQTVIEKKLTIRIAPPFYLSVWAYIIYMLLLIAAAYWLMKMYNQRIETRHKRQMRKLAQQKEHELYELKFNFFTNISHEIRTPLTLIKGSLDDIVPDNKVNLKENLHIISSNVNRLLLLINQLLDFRKADSEGKKLNFSMENISEIIREQIQNFEQLMKNKGIDFKASLPEKDSSAPVNKEAFIKIVSNLLNNAVKYAGSSCQLSLKVKDTTFELTLSNDGKIIPLAERDNIFKEFYRSKSNNEGETGSGIGLTYARNLAQLHNGSLKMDNNESVNTFILILPTHQENVIDKISSDLPEEIAPQADNLETPPNKRRELLLIEDNKQMLQFLKKKLSARYTVVTAESGEEGLKLLPKHDLSLIISDVMMDGMSGFDVCKQVKNDISYSHIPIILLTARADIDSKIQGMELGADDYIEKPFNWNFLEAKIKNILENREKLRKIYFDSPYALASSIGTNKTEEEFVVNINNIIQQHLTDPDFSIDIIAEKMNMSRSSLYRKIHSMLQMSPNDFIKLERLKAAARLLSENKYSINEVSYKMGFSSPSYFSKCFTKQFGVMPKDFIKGKAEKV